MTSDSKWRLYGTEDLSLAEQEFDLRASLVVSASVSEVPPASPLRGSPHHTAAWTSSTPGGTPALPPSSAHRFGLMRPSALPGIAIAQSVTAFAFGPPVSWGYFTVLFLASNGAVYALCPVCPLGKEIVCHAPWVGGRNNLTVFLKSFLVGKIQTIRFWLTS